jgi:hypothetical protein
MSKGTFIVITIIYAHSFLIKPANKPVVATEMLKACKNRKWVKCMSNEEVSIVSETRQFIIE